MGYLSPFCLSLLFFLSSTSSFSFIGGWICNEGGKVRPYIFTTAQFLCISPPMTWNLLRCNVIWAKSGKNSPRNVGGKKIPAGKSLWGLKKKVQSWVLKGYSDKEREKKCLIFSSTILDTHLGHFGFFAAMQIDIVPPAKLDLSATRGAQFPRILAP